MAASSLDGSFQTTSKAGDVSLARQRRRRTTRRPGTKSLSQTEPQNGDTRSMSLTQSSESLTTPAQPPTPVNGSLTTTGTARQRRSQRKRESLKKTVTAIIEPQTVLQTSQHELEDSTAGVASLLERNLDQTDDGGGEATEQIQNPEAQGEVIVNHSTESPNRHTSEEQDQNQPESGPTINEGRPLPPRLDLPVRTSGSPTTAPLSNEIFGLVIHQTDILRASVNITHPCVRVSIVDTSEETGGAYAKKSNPTKCVTSYYESSNPAVDYILPVLTQPFDTNDRSKNLLPEWEETLIFNEHPTHFVDNEKLIIFFEVLDFPTSASMAMISHRQSRLDSSPWYKIAWGFVRPAGKIGKSQMGEKCRLQLFQYPRRRFRRLPEANEVYNLWSRGYRVAYPSTLYVTLKPIANGPIDSALPSPQPFRRSMLPTQREEGSVTFEQLMLRQVPATNSSANLLDSPSKLLSASARLPGQACHIPTTNHAMLYPTKMGCSCLLFSHSGRLLAAGCAGQGTAAYPVILFEVPLFKMLLTTEGHHGIIYGLSWTQNDQLLASASADGLVKVWSLTSPTASEPLAVLPHPCYVYAVCFSSSDTDTEQLVFTGAYDSVIRVWSITTDSYKLICELRGHSGLVNCLVCSDKRILYAGDSQGQLGVWQEKQGAWQMKKTINIVNGAPLVSLSLHPSGRKMLLHTNKGQLLMLDLRIDRPCCEFRGLLLSQSQRCSSFIAPCGGLVFAGGSRGQVNVWESDTGKLQHVYTELPFTTAIYAMAYHPTEHMLAISAFGSHQPLVVCTHISNGAETNNHTLSTTVVEPGSGKETGIMKQDSMILHLNQRLREVTKTLNRATRPAAEGREIRKK